jgi:sugar lactone lactonase YvrE
VSRRGVLAAGGAVVIAGVLTATALLHEAPAENAVAPILGVRPGYGPASVSGVPNEAAIVRRIWVPGLDDGYNPQGLAVAGDSVLVAAYRSDSPDIHRGPCRVFRVDLATGRASGQLDVPPPCGHAGGLATTAAPRRLYVADTHTLFAATLDGAFGGAARFAIHPLGPGLIGGLAVSGEDAIWLGAYREEGPARLYRFAAAALDAMPDGAPLNASDATVQVAIPSYAQGAAIDPGGDLWVARSTLRWGEFDRLDVASGRLEREYAAPPGIEGIAFDAAGRLWVVSEAGARHYFEGWRALVLPFYPLIVSIDPAQLN